MDGITYPEARLNVFAAARSLADRAFQDRYWVTGDPLPGGIYDELDLPVHILYDDYEVLPDPASAVGFYLFENEVQSFVALNARLSPVIDELGDVPDPIYVADPRWNGVVDAAQAAYDAMRANGTDEPEIVRGR